MGRPKASDNIRELAAAFANVVTIATVRRYDWVARLGKHSIYTLLGAVAPKVIIFDLMRSSLHVT